MSARNAALLMHNAGYKIVGIAEWDGGLYNPNGIDVHDCGSTGKRKGPSTVSRSRGRPTEELLFTECEILIPAATENVITGATPTR